jgi:putative membrane protein
MNILRGMVIGVANIIPGVSGGTLALVLGIYERLIGAINNISFETVKASFGLLKFNKDGWKNFTANFIGSMPFSWLPF